MPSSQRPASTRKLASRLAVAGMGLAVLALGTLAVWAAVVTQNHAHGLTEAGVQTSGHLRAVLALGLIDAQADALEDSETPGALAKLRRSQRVLDDSLDRMEQGEFRHAREIAIESRPLVEEQLKPALRKFLAQHPHPHSHESEAAHPEEEAVEEALTDLQVVMNNLDADPSALLASKLDSVTDSERTVRGTAYVLIPLGLGSVAACGWLLSLYRRRSEATMRSALYTSAEEARTDQLTGLPNRRALLEEFASLRSENKPFTLTLADLNGFKRYNDTFGHPAGDALLKRLGTKLAKTCRDHGTAGRLGGDEFCVLLYGDRSSKEADALLREALNDSGEGFRISAATGLCSVPREARDASSALRLADTRMYAAKVSRSPEIDEAMAAALTRMLDERHPGLGSHGRQVAHLAVGCAEKLGLTCDEVRAVKRAAELHDLGKVAIPGAILNKEEPLTGEEWEFMCRHSVIGARIISGVPSLERVATMVRSSHERWDGNGYPDGLIGDGIPVGSRIIFAADAYCAMTESRPYAKARSVESTRLELEVCSGSQFDPAVVEALLDLLDEQDAPPDGNVPAAPAPAVAGR